MRAGVPNSASGRLLPVDVKPGTRQSFTVFGHLDGRGTQELDLASVERRAMRAAVDHGSELVGIVENMVGGELTGSAGDDLAAEFGIPVVARIPWHPTPDTWNHLAAQL